MPKGKQTETEFTFEAGIMPKPFKNKVYNDIIEKALSSPNGEYKVLVPNIKTATLLQALRSRIKNQQFNKTLTLAQRSGNLWIIVEKKVEEV
jgi:hypothetical protein